MTQPAKPTCFVVSTIGASGSPERKEADTTLKFLVRRALDSDFTIVRGDEHSDPGLITPTIIAAILEADLVVADLSGLNPNVFYELAVAHAYETPTVLIQKESDKIPFDLKDMRTVKYNLSDPQQLEDAQATLRKYALHALEGETQVTPLSSANRYLSVAESSDPVAQSNVQILEAITDLGFDLSRQIRQVTANPPGEPSQQSRYLEDMASMRKLIERVVVRRATVSQDFNELITETTSGGFDTWIEELLAKIDPDLEPSERMQLLYNSPMRHGRPEE